MTGKTSPVRRKRRPQRSNSLKDIGRLLGVAGTAHDAETHVLVMLIQEKTSLHVAGNRAIRAALELIQQRGYVIIPPKPAT